MGPSQPAGTPGSPGHDRGLERTLSPVKDPETQAGRAGGLARAVLALAALWIAAGALFKLLEGSPNDLPPIVRDTLAIDLGLKYRLAIGVELAIALLALLRPSLGWRPVVLLLVVFNLILLMSLDEESCGCFGKTFPLSPAQMMAIDSTLLLAVLAGRPWRGYRDPSAPLLVALPLAAGALALPWLLDREVALPDEPRLTGTEGGDGAPPADDGYVIFDVEAWTGQLVHDTPLARFTDPNALPDTGRYVFWRWTCDHCAKHLEQLALHDAGTELLALIRLEDPDDTEANRAVYSKPSGPHVTEVALAPGLDYVVTTPAEMAVEGYTIVAAEEAVEIDDGHDH